MKKFRVRLIGFTFGRLSLQAPAINSSHIQIHPVIASREVQCSHLDWPLLLLVL